MLRQRQDDLNSGRAGFDWLLLRRDVYTRVAAEQAQPRACPPEQAQTASTEQVCCKLPQAVNNAIAEPEAPAAESRKPAAEPGPGDAPELVSATGEGN